MCGRFYIEDSPSLTRMIETINRGPVRLSRPTMSGEISPGSTVPVIAVNRQRKPAVFAMDWGYHLQKKLVFNARSETAYEKPLFRDGWLQRRCIIPALWYYEWDPGKNKYAIAPQNGLTFLAGLYRMEEQPVFTILTRAPGSSTGSIHPRMPLILPQDCLLSWIDPGVRAEQVASMALTEMTVTPVGQLSCF